MQELTFEEIQTVDGGLTPFEAGQWVGGVVGKAAVMIGVATGIAAFAIAAMAVGD